MKTFVEMTWNDPHAIFPQTIAMIHSEIELMQLIPTLDMNTTCLHKTDGL